MGRGPVIGVTFRAGTAEFFEDLTKVKVAVRSTGTELKDMGSHGVTGVQATSGALRVLEGGLNNNLRAAERFTANVLGLGPILQAAFPLIGGIAFAGLLVKLGEELHKFYTELRDAPELAAASFAKLRGDADLTNDSLAVTNARLENQIAKLEGKHENTLKLAIMEARLEADKLVESLQKSNKELFDVLEKSAPGLGKQLFDTFIMGAEPGVTRLVDNVKKELFGLSGVGGGFAEINRINLKGHEELNAAAKLPTGTDDEKHIASLAKEAAQQKLNNSLLVEYQRQLGITNAALDELTRARDTAAQRNIENAKVDPLVDATRNTRPDRTNYDKYIVALQATQNQLRSKMDQIELTATNETLTGRRDKDIATRANSKMDAPLDNKINDLKQQIASATEKLKAAGLDETSKLIAKSEGDALKAIEEVNKAMLRQGQPKGNLIKPDVGAGDKRAEEIRGLTTSLDRVEAETKLAEKVTDAANRMRDEIKVQEMLNAAIGKGFEAQRAVNVEVELMRRLGASTYQEAQKNPMSDAFAQASIDRVLATNVAEAKHTEQLALSAQKISNQIALEKILADTQALGAYAVQRAALAEELRQQKASASGLTAAQEQLAWDKFNAEQVNRSAEEVAKINEKVAANDRLTSAILKGADAVRVAQLSNKLAAIDRQGDPDGSRGLAAIREEQAAHEEELARAAVHTDRVQKIDDEIAKLNEAKKILGDTVAIEQELRTLENDRIKALVQESLGMRGARDGVRAFFLEMQMDAKSTASIIYETLNSALDKSTSNIAKLLTGQHKKGDWSKEFKDIGDTMAESSIKSLATRGLGALGKHFGIDIGGAKPDGTRNNPIWVKLADVTGGKGIGKLPLGAPGPWQMPSSDSGDDGGPRGNVFGGDMGGGIFSLLDKPSGGAPGEGGGGIWSALLSALIPRAGGGDVDPGGAYVVGEKQPELFVPSTSGRIVPSLGGVGGGGVTIIGGPIDARGSDLGAGNRIQRGVEASHRDAISKAVQASHERAKRVPSK